MKFNEKLFELRKSKGLSQEQLAEKLDVSRQAVSKWETGDAFPEAPKLLAIAKLFGVTTDFLLDDSLDSYTAPKNRSNNDALEKVHSEAGNFFRKHGWILGIILAVYGAYRTIISLVGISQFIRAASVTGNSGFIISPVLSALTGLIIAVAGVVSAIKLKKKNNN